MKTTICVLFLAMALGTRGKADAIYNILINTNPYQGQTGYVDFQLGRGPDSQSVFTNVAGFYLNGALSSTPAQVAGGVTGAFPGTVTLTNSSQFNDYFKGVTYGTTMVFQLVFTGPAVNAPNGTSVNGSPFYFGLYDSSQSPIGPNDGFGNALLIAVNTNGSLTPQVYNNAITVIDGTVPEPGALGIVALGLAGALAVAGRKSYLS